jgi:hypothetical protein
LILAVTSGAVCEGPAFETAKGKKETGWTCGLSGDTHNLDVEAWVFADSLRSDFEEPVPTDANVRNKTGVKSVYQDRDLAKYSGEIPVEKRKLNLKRRERRMKCWSTLLAHMCGFAAINAGNTMAHLEVFASSPMMTLIPLVINQLITAGMFTIFKYLRDALASQREAAGGAGVRAKMFDEEVVESENDILCLAGSYLMISSSRFFLVGALPSMLGEIEEETPWSSIYSLYVLGLALSLGSAGLIVLKSLGKEKENKEGEMAEEGVGDRVLDVAIGMFGMSFAWACLYASRTVFEKEPFLQESLAAGMETITGRILLALVLSVICLVIVFFLDFIGDGFKKRFPGKRIGVEVVEQIVFAKSILVGFSWEHAFDGGVEAIASTTSRPQVADTVIAALVFIIIVPAWRKHILKKAIVLKEYAVEEREHEDRLRDYVPPLAAAE